MTDTNNIIIPSDWGNYKRGQTNDKPTHKQHPDNTHTDQEPNDNVISSTKKQRKSKDTDKSNNNKSPTNKKRKKQSKSNTNDTDDTHRKKRRHTKDTTDIDEVELINNSNEDVYKPTEQSIDNDNEFMKTTDELWNEPIPDITTELDNVNDIHEFENHAIDNILNTENNCNNVTCTTSETNKKIQNENAIAMFTAVKKCINQQQTVEVPDMTLQMDTILSRIPYHTMLDNLFGGLDIDEMKQNNVPVVCKAYEESLMRECIYPNEKKCVMGDNCECRFIDEEQPFTATEFLLPGELSTDHAQMCVLCSRKYTQQLYHDMVFKGVKIRGVIQRFGNICDQPGEYARTCMLICPPSHNVYCMPLPITAHQRNRYSVFISNGIRYLKQHRVSYENFM